MLFSLSLGVGKTRERVLPWMTSSICCRGWLRLAADDAEHAGILRYNTNAKNSFLCGAAGVECVCM